MNLFELSKQTGEYIKQLFTLPEFKDFSKVLDVSSDNPPSIRYDFRDIPDGNLRVFQEFNIIRVEIYPVSCDINVEDFSRFNIIVKALHKKDSIISFGVSVGTYESISSQDFYKQIMLALRDSIKNDIKGLPQAGTL